LFEAFVELTGEELQVYSCIDNEPHRSWAIGKPRNFTLKILPGYRKHISDISHIYVNPSIVFELMRLKPNVVVAAGFSPTMLLAWGYARVRRIPFGISTDGVPSIDPGERSRPHRWMRKLMVPTASLGICASDESVDLLARWGLDRSLSTVTPLVPPWDPPPAIPGFDDRPYDILFAGTLNEDIKGALFFADVVARMAEKRKDLKIRVTGNGPLRQEVEQRLQRTGLTAHFDGAVQPNDMASSYLSAKLLLFPSRGDVWGLVANEAVQCGTPVLGSDLAASSRLFLERFGVGLMRPLVVDAWAQTALGMIESRQHWQAFMARRQEALDWANIDAAASGFKRAIDIGRGRTTASAI
jgi:glycosyltransferase involved in cell wall biosynthesis